MTEPSNPWRTFGLAVIATIALAGVLGIGYALGSGGGDDTSATATPSTAPQASTTAATVEQSTTLPTSTTTTTTTATTQPAPPTTFFFVQHWSIDLLQKWRVADPRLAADLYTGSLPPASEAESQDLTRVKQRMEAGSRNMCKRIADDGQRFLDMTWGAFGILTAEESTRQMHQMLMYECPENA